MHLRYCRRFRRHSFHCVTALSLAFSMLSWLRHISFGALRAATRIFSMSLLLFTVYYIIIFSISSHIFFYFASFDTPPLRRARHHSYIDYYTIYISANRQCLILLVYTFISSFSFIFRHSLPNGMAFEQVAFVLMRICYFLRRHDYADNTVTSSESCCAAISRSFNITSKWYDIFVSIFNMRGCFFCGSFHFRFFIDMRNLLVDVFLCCILRAYLSRAYLLAGSRYNVPRQKRSASSHLVARWAAAFLDFKIDALRDITYCWYCCLLMRWRHAPGEACPSRQRDHTLKDFIYILPHNTMIMMTFHRSFTLSLIR